MKLNLYFDLNKPDKWLDQFAQIFKNYPARITDSSVPDLANLTVTNVQPVVIPFYADCPLNNTTYFFDLGTVGAVAPVISGKNVWYFGDVNYTLITQSNATTSTRAQFGCYYSDIATQVLIDVLDTQARPLSRVGQKDSLLFQGMYCEVAGTESIRASGFFSGFKITVR